MTTIDPDTLATISTYVLPTAIDPAGTKTYQNFTGGGYFYLDDRDRAVIPTTTRHVFVIRQTGGGTGFAVERDHDAPLVGIERDADEIVFRRSHGRGRG